jgi:hypothetical protein
VQAFVDVEGSVEVVQQFLRLRAAQDRSDGIGG